MHYLYIHDLNSCLRHSINFLLVVFPIAIAAVDDNWWDDHNCNYSSSSNTDNCSCADREIIIISLQCLSIHNEQLNYGKSLTSLLSLVPSIILVVLGGGVLTLVTLSSCAAISNWLQTTISNDSMSIFILPLMKNTQVKACTKLKSLVAKVQMQMGSGFISPPECPLC